MARNDQTQDFLKQLEERLRLNRGGFSAQGHDVNPTGYILPGAPLRSPLLPGSSVPDVQRPPLPASPPINVQQVPAPQVPQQSQGSNRSESAKLLDAVVATARGQQDGVQQLQDGGILTTWGDIIYPDGTIRSGDTIDTRAYPAQSLPNGDIRYSDRSVKTTLRMVEDLGNGLAVYSDGSVRTYGATRIEGGLAGLQQALFGRQVPITQAYGNYNPQLEPNPQGINYGTDFGVINEVLMNPFAGAKVIESGVWDGERDPYKSNTQGYGNFVWIELSTGERLRFSHLRDAPSFQAGQTLNSGDIIGVTGDTGNVTGPHLDLEYYDANRQLANPEQFSGLTNPEQVGVSTEMGKMVGRVDPDTGAISSITPSLERQRKQQEQQNKDTQQPQQSQQPQQQVQQVAPQQTNIPQIGTADAVTNVLGSKVENVPGAIATAGQRVGAPELGASEFTKKVVDRIKDPIQPGKYNVQGGVGKQKDLGVTEALNLGGINTQRGAWDINTPIGQVNVPDLGISEVGGAIDTKLQNAISNVGGIISGKTGVSQNEKESGRGAVPQTQLGSGLGATITDVLGKASSLVDNVLGQAGSLADNLKTGGGGLVQPVYADEGKKGGVPTGAELSQTSTQGAGTVSAQEPTFNIRSIKAQVPQSELSPLLQRIYDLEQQGQTNVNSKKAAKLYNRYQEMRAQLEGQLPANLRGTPEGESIIRQNMAGATLTGYASPEADERAQDIRAEKEKYYQSKGAYAGIGDKGSYDKVIKYLEENKTGLPEGTSANIQRSANVQPGTGSAVKLTSQFGGQEPLSNVGNITDPVGQTDVFIDAGGAPNTGVVNKTRQPNPFDKLVGDLFKKLDPLFNKFKNPFKG